jgi:adenylate cyclase
MDRQEHKVERRLAAIFAADVAGYSRLMNQDEVGTLRTLTAHREIMDRLIIEHGGRIANTAGDSVLAEFPSAVDAVQCAVAVQEAMAQAAQDTPEDNCLRFRIGIHVGDVMIQEGDLFGDGVNVAARLQALAQPGGTCISAAIHDYVRKCLGYGYTDLGLQQVKNLDEPIRVYSVEQEPSPNAPKQVVSSLPVPDRPSIAVLPFVNLTGDPQQDYFADGVVEDIITALARVRWFFVIARNSTFTYKGQSVDLKQVGRDLGIRYVLQGSIRKSGQRVRITGQLVEASTGHHLWADRFEGSLEDIFELQDRITESVVAAIEPNVRAAEIGRAKSKPTDRLDAYDLYLRALTRHYLMTRDDLAEAQRLLARAICLDPDYSLAKAFSAFNLMHQISQGWIDESEREVAVRLAKEALTANRDDPVTLRYAAMLLAYLGRDYDAAAAALDRALTLNPNSAEVRASVGWVQNFIGNGKAAIDHLERALRWSPLDPEKAYVQAALASAYTLTGDYEEAVTWGKQAVQEKPSWIPAYRILISPLVFLGRFDEARQVGKTVLTLDPELTVTKFRRVQPYRDTAFAERVISALREAGIPD